MSSGIINFSNTDFKEMTTEYFPFYYYSTDRDFITTLTTPSIANTKIPRITMSSSDNSDITDSITTTSTSENSSPTTSTTIPTTNTATSTKVSTDPSNISTEKSDLITTETSKTASTIKTTIAPGLTSEEYISTVNPSGKQTDLTFSPIVDADDKLSSKSFVTNNPSFDYTTYPLVLIPLS